MGRNPCCSKEQGLNKGAWTTLEDKILTEYIQLRGEGKWRNIPKLAGLKRCGKSCRLRWLNYLRPDIKRGNITRDEEDLIVRLHKLLGNRWSLIAGRLPGRTDNEIKNYWNTVLSKKAKSPDEHQQNLPCLKKNVVAKQTHTKVDDTNNKPSKNATPNQENDSQLGRNYPNQKPEPEPESSDDKSCDQLPDFGIDFNQLIGGINLSEFLNSDDYSELESDVSLPENGDDGDRQLSLDAGFGSLDLFLEQGDQEWML